MRDVKWTDKGSQISQCMNSRATRYVGDCYRQSFKRHDGVRNHGSFLFWSHAYTYTLEIRLFNCVRVVSGMFSGVYTLGYTPRMPIPLIFRVACTRLPMIGPFEIHMRMYTPPNNNYLSTFLHPHFLDISLHDWLMMFLDDESMIPTNVCPIIYTHIYIRPFQSTCYHRIYAKILNWWTGT
jgi:hypothetical protein